MKILGISSPYLPPWLTCFPVANVSKAQWDRDRNMDAIMENSVAHGQNHLFFTVRISKNDGNTTLVHFVGWFIHAL